MEGTLLYWGLREKGEILFYQETLFVGESDSYVKEGSGNGQLSPLGNMEGGFVYRGL
jgi:hypothetical protein